ncbi:DUF2065 domain-containing protein [Curvivirga sp.]|uniref:DUF2065 domain-containing protein n=1 Tax=Curvivirga sp. TaxID=2856848 RepID=UPI003B5CE74E
MDNNDFWAALATAAGLVFVLEGAIYALFPQQMKNMMVQIMSMPASNIRKGGLIAAFIGCAIVWLIRG